ncbi:MAG: glycosyl transferase, group 1/2 family protein [Anaerolineae bacterium]|nr:MAG: glycosyl transferase, group 1/2 family protein [Anaerolineae bacterium]
MNSGNNRKTIVIYSFDPWDHALAYQRYRAPAEKLGWNILRGCQDGQCHFDFIKKSDYVLIQRTFPASYKNYRRIMDIAKQENKPVIYEIDDLLIAMPEDHPFLTWFTSTLEYILLAVIEADRVIVSSDTLRDLFLPFNPDIATWPSYPPDWIWPSIPPDAQGISKDDKVRIGFMGGLTHGVDLDMILPVLRQLANETQNKLEFHFWGSAPSEFINSQTYLHHMEEVLDYRQHAELVTQMKVEIFIAPLVDNLFNRCKSSIKYWEYSALGVGGVYSNLDPYARVITNRENGLLASTLEEWYHSLKLLIDNQNLRHRVAQNAYMHYIHQGRMSLHLEEWRQIIGTTTVKTNNILNSSRDHRYAYYRFAEQLCSRTEEKEKLIKQLTEDLSSLTQQLDSKNRELYAIYSSKSWRLSQILSKTSRFLLRKS